MSVARFSIRASVTRLSVTTNPVFVLSSAAAPAPRAIWRFPHGCRTATLPELSSRGIPPAACIADTPARPVRAERFFLRTLVIAQHTRQQPRHRVNHHHRRQRAIRQHIIADRQFVIRQLLANPLIKPFIVPGHEQQIRFLRQFARNRLAERPARRRQAKSLCVFSRAIASTASKIGSGFNNMPGPPPNGRSSTVLCRSCV